MCPLWERITNNSRLDHWSIAPLISWLSILQHLFRTCFRRSTSSIFWRYTSCWRAPQWNNPPDSDQVSFVVSLAAQWSDGHFPARKPPCVLICEMVHRPVGMWNCSLTVDECPVTNHSLEHDHSNTHCLSWPLTAPRREMFYPAWTQLLKR